MWEVPARKAEAMKADARKLKLGKLKQGKLKLVMQCFYHGQCPATHDVFPNGLRAHARVHVHMCFER